MTDPAPDSCLATTPLVDSDHPAVQALVQQHAPAGTDREGAVALYDAALPTCAITSRPGGCATR